MDEKLEEEGTCPLRRNLCVSYCAWYVHEIDKCVIWQIGSELAGIKTELIKIRKRNEAYHNPEG